MELSEESKESKIIQNSDYLYKSDVKWRSDIVYEDPSPYELKMLEGTIKPDVLLKQEREEGDIKLTPEQQRRNAINIVKVVSLYRIGLHHYIFKPYKLSSNQKKKYKNSMQIVLDEYNESSISRDKIIKEFNEIVCDEILDNVNDVSQYPVYDISKDTDSHEVLS
jgi:hypothetical protein